jgi:hypothetical protein
VGQKKVHGVAAVICFACGSVAWGKKKRRGGLRARPHEGRRRERKGALSWRSAARSGLQRAPGHRARVAPLVHEHGRAAAVGDAVTQVNVADERDRGEAGPGVSGGV